MSAAEAELDEKSAAEAELDEKVGCQSRTRRIFASAPVNGELEARPSAILGVRIGLWTVMV